MFGLVKKKQQPPQVNLGSLPQKITYGVGIVVGLAVLAPVATLALSAVTSLASMVFIGLGIFGTLVALPAISRWWKIMVLKMLKASARMNPVETLELEYISRKKAYDEAAQYIVKISALRDSLRERLDEFKQKHGTADDGLERMSQKLSTLTDRVKATYKHMGEKLETFRQFVERQKDRWDIAKETGELANMLKDAQGADVTQAFLSDTAVDTIRNELNLSFNQLEQILAEEEVKQLTGLTSPRLLEIKPETIEMEPVPRR